MTSLNRLRTRIDSAISILAPRFGATQEELAEYGEPLPVIGTHTHFNSTTREIMFKPEHAGNEQALGEEVAHYVHCAVNPCIRSAPRNLDELNVKRYVMEAVGHYGCLVYLAESGIEYDPVKWVSAPDLNGEDLWNYIAHEKGYKRAVRLFELHGNASLPNLSRMSQESAYFFLPRIAPRSLYERRFLPIKDSLMVNVFPYLRF